MLGNKMTMTPSMLHHSDHGNMMKDQMNDSIHHHGHDMIGDAVTQMTHGIQGDIKDHVSHGMMNGMNHDMSGNMMATTHDMMHGDMSGNMMATAHDMMHGGMSGDMMATAHDMMHGDMHGGDMHGDHTMTMHSMPDSFFFSKRTTDLLFHGWTVASNNQFVLALFGIILVALLMELGRRMTRELHIKISLIDKQLYVQSSHPSATAAPLLSFPPEANGNSPYSSKEETTNGKDSTIPYEVQDRNQTKKTAKVWKINQEGFFQLKTDNTNCSNTISATDGHTQGNGTEHEPVIDRQDTYQVASMKRNMSFDLSRNRWDTSVEGNCNQLDSEKMLSSFEKRKLCLNRLLCHSLITTLHTCQVVMGYMLMLVVMSYNVWLLLAVLTGAAIGYLIFSWDRIILNTTSYSRVPRVETGLTSSV